MDDEAPITVVPEQPAAATGAAITASSASRSRTGLFIGIVLTGLAAATAIGYIIGTRTAATLVVETTKTVEPAPADTTPSRPAETAATTATAATEQPAQKPAAENRPHRPGQASAAHAKPAPQPASAATSATASDPEEQQWSRMRAELAACGKANLVCHEKIRWRYCKHLWGKVPDCPQASANVPSS